MSLKSITTVTTSTINIKMNYYSYIDGYSVTGYNMEIYNSSGSLVHNPIRLTGTQIGNPSGTFFTNGYNITAMYNHRTTANYRIKTYISTTGGNKKVNEVWTKGGSLSSSPYAYSITKTSAYLTWGSASDITGYGVEVYRSYVGNGNPVYDSYGLTSRTRYISGLSPGTTYAYKVYAIGILANGPERTGTFTTTSPQLPTSITTLNLSVSSTANTITASWSGVSYADGYRVELYSGASTNPSSSNFIKSKSTTGTSLSFYSSDGVNSYSWYSIKVYGYNSDGNGGWKADYIRTSDTVSPTVSITSSDGNGRIYVAYSASDSGSGLRDSNRFALHIGSANGGSTTTKHQFYTNNYQTSFDSDVNGNAFVHNAYYWVKVYAYDRHNNISSAAAVQIQYKMTHPGSWEWHVSKVKGNNVTVTAVEWDSLCKKINQFRTYKGHSVINFTPVGKGTNITASIVNEARNAIAAMSPPTSAPPAVNKGDDITAYFFNRLVDSLNSIK